MAHIFRRQDVSFRIKNTPISEFAWHTSPNLAEMAQSKHMHFDIRQLDPGKYSYPYHFHRNAEELFIIVSGKVILRTPDGIQELASGDMAFFEMGPTGAHQLFNHTQTACEYIDIRTEAGIDVCEYPDSGKVNILPERNIFEVKNQIDYFKGEENVEEIWAAIWNKE